MPDHKLSLDVLNVVSSGAPRDRRPSLIARITARLRTDRYDRLLAVGVSPEPGSALAAHRVRVTSAVERHAVAGSLQQAVRAASSSSSSVLSARIPVNVADVIAAGELIDRVNQRLLAPGPIGALGMARLRLVLSDGAGPFYRMGRGDLAGRLGAALAEL